jgi:CRP/FNR family cyclic AMP-dependent transcriptional regulator
MKPMQDALKSVVDRKAILSGSLFGQFGDEALASICQVARVLHFDCPTLMSAAGQAHTSLYLVVQGHIEVIARHAGGDEFVIGLITPGRWSSWVPCFSEHAPEHDFYAATKSCLIALPITSVQAFCQTYPEAYLPIIRQIGRRTRLLMNWLGQSVLVGPLQRVAKLLYVLALEQEDAPQQLTLVITQYQLARMAGCSRQTANSLLNELVDLGLVILSYRQIHIPSLPKLATFANQQLAGRRI